MNTPLKTFVRAGLLPLVGIFLVFQGLCFPPRAFSDWVNLSGAETSRNIAEVYVEEDQVRVVLEIYVGDIPIFEDLVPDSWIKKVAAKRPPENVRLKNIANKLFRITTPNGRNLPVQIQKVEPRLRIERFSPLAGMINPYSRQRIPEAPEDKRVLYAELLYPLQGKPDSLQIFPPLDQDGLPIATFGFVTYHKSVPVIDFRYLSQGTKLALDWEDPWYSRFENKNLRRHHKDAIMSYLYVEPYEVRHEIVTRVRDIGDWTDLELRGDIYIERDELEPLKQKITEFLLKKNPLKVDGELVEPVLDRASYISISVKGIQILDNPERLEQSTALIGVILAYPTSGIPNTVTVDWELFSDRIQQVPTNAIDPAGPFQGSIDPENNVLVWKNYLKKYTIPTVEQVKLESTVSPIRVSIASGIWMILVVVLFVFMREERKRLRYITAMAFVVGSIALWPVGKVSVHRPASFVWKLNDEDSRTILDGLLRNVYRSFDFRDEEKVYDKLALTVDGEMLRDLYLESRRSLVIEKAGGAQAKVQKVDLKSVKAEQVESFKPAFNLNAEWTITGRVGHWGHEHTRENLYHANIQVEGVGKAWKITGIDLIEEKRLS